MITSVTTFSDVTVPNSANMPGKLDYFFLDNPNQVSDTRRSELSQQKQLQTNEKWGLKRNFYMKKTSWESGIKQQVDVGIRITVMGLPDICQQQKHTQAM